MNSLLVQAVEASIKAGEVIVQVYATNFEVVEKSDKSPVTQADLKADAVIKNYLSASKLPFISEEDIEYDYSQRAGFERYWLVDPLDGTAEFVKRNGEFTVNIALIEKNKPVLGVVYAPITDTLWYTLNKGIGKIENAKQYSSINQTILETHQLKTLHQNTHPFTVLVSRSHRLPGVDAYIDTKIRPEHPDLVIATKGSSLKFMCMAEKEADIYVCYSNTKEWDTAAAEAVLRAAGGQVLRVDDLKPLDYNKPEFANPPFIALPPMK